MNAPSKLASFALAIALLFGGGYAIGAAVGPFDSGTDARQDAPPDWHGTHGFEEDQ